jgi:hypothetical protein
VQGGEEAGLGGRGVHARHQQKNEHDDAGGQHEGLWQFRSATAMLFGTADAARWCACMAEACDGQSHDPRQTATRSAEDAVTGKFILEQQAAAAPEVKG